MLKLEFKVECQWDGEAQVWYVAESNVPGLVCEAATTEAMSALIQERVRELLLLNLPEVIRQARTEACGDVPLELLWHRQERIRLGC